MGLSYDKEFGLIMRACRETTMASGSMNIDKKHFNPVAFCSDSLLWKDWSLAHLVNRYQQHAPILRPILPGPSLTLTPWSSTTQIAWNTGVSRVSSTRSVRPIVHNEWASINGSRQSYSPPPLRRGDLTLQPAPGEVFNISFHVGDEFLNTLKATVYETVSCRLLTFSCLHTTDRKSLTFCTAFLRIK